MQSRKLDDGEVRHKVEIEVLNPRGRVAEFESVSVEDHDYPRLFELWKLAQSSARGGEQLIDELLHELQ